MSLRCAYIDHGKGGPPDILRLAEREMEAPPGGIEVAYAGVNRPDVLQRSGSYPPPPGASPHLGLEVSGKVIATGPQASRWRVGDQVCALTPGGGYAQYCLADERHCLPVPRGMDLLTAAAIPENYYGLDQCVRARPAGGGRAFPGARRLQRHRPDRHPARAPSAPRSGPRWATPRRRRPASRPARGTR